MNGKSAQGIPISEDTRQRVLDAAAQLGYTANPVAQMLARGQNNLIGVFTYEETFPSQQADVFFPYLLGVQEEAGKQGYDVLLFTHSQPGDVKEIYENGANSLRLADGSILLGAHPDYQELERLLDERYPFVFIGRRSLSGYDLDWVVNDYAAGSETATRHLLDLGHRRIGLIQGHPEFIHIQDMSRGSQAAVSRVADARLFEMKSDMLNPEALRQIIETHHLTALVCTDRGNFEQLMFSLSQLGFQIPADMSVVTLDPIDRDGGIHEATRLWLDRHTVGIEAVRLLIDRLANPGRPAQHILVPCTFAAGKTTAAAGE
jgi:DNA-binding LacI/PurR family transcriptional regulator